MWRVPRQNRDLEAVVRVESPELLWFFIRKVYSIMSFQMLMTVAVAAVVSVRPIFEFFTNTGPGSTLFILLILSPFIVLGLLYYYREQHPLNYFLLGLFSMSISFGLGLACALTSVKLILESVILIAGLAVSLTLFTFWATRRGYNFNSHHLFLLAIVFVLILFALIQAFFPLGKTSVMIYGGLASTIFFGYFIYKTNNLISRYSHNGKYIWAYADLYLDIINRFLSFLTSFRASET